MRAPSSETLTGGLMHRRVERRLCNSRRPFNLAQRQLGLRLLLQVEAFESRQRLLRVRAIVVPLGAVELTHVRGGFWRFDPDVPAELRAERPGLYRIEDAERVDAERNDRRSRACGWLEMTA